MNRRSDFIFWGVVLCLHLISIFYQLHTQNWYIKDSYEYIFAAQNILDYNILYAGDLDDPLRMDFYTKRPPVYPLLIALGLLITASPVFMIIIQHVLSIINIILAFRILNILEKPLHTSDSMPSVHSGSISRYIFLILLMLYPTQFVYAGLIMTEILFQTLITGAVYCLLKAWEQYPFKWLMICTALVILSMLTKPIMYLFAIPHLFIVGYFIVKMRKWSWILMALLPLLVVYGYQSWNEQRTGYFHFSSIQNLSLFQYTTYNLLVQEMGEEDATQYTDSVLYESLEQSTYREEQKMISEFCVSTIRDNLGAYLNMHLKGMINFFIDPGRFDLFHFFDIQEQGTSLLKSFSSEGYTGIFKSLSQQPVGMMVILIGVGIGNAVKLVMSLLFAFDRRWDIRHRFTILIFIVYISGLTGTSGASRFAVPIGMLLMVIATVELRRIYTKFHRRFL